MSTTLKVALDFNVNFEVRHTVTIFYAQYLYSKTLLNRHLIFVFKIRFQFKCFHLCKNFCRTIQTEKEKQTVEGRKAASDMFSDDFTPTLSNKQLIRGSDSQDPNLQVSECHRAFDFGSEYHSLTWKLRKMV